MKKKDKLYNYLFKVFIYLKKETIFYNIRNKNIKNLAYREYCYKKLYKKYKYKIDEFKFDKCENKVESKFVWICWFQGIENAPKLVQTCINSINKNLNNKEIIVLTDDNLNEYVKFPEYIEKKYKKGIISKAHYSDLVRLEVLNKYGGLWIDATVFVTEPPKDTFFKNELFVYKNISLDQKNELCVRASNWLIYSLYKGNPIIQLTEKLLLEYWKKSNYTINYNIFHLFFTMATKKYDEMWKNVPTFSNVDAHLLQFELLKEFSEERFDEIKNISVFHKLNHRIYTENKNSFYYKIINGEDYE